MAIESNVISVANPCDVVYTSNACRRVASQTSNEKNDQRSNTSLLHWQTKKWRTQTISWMDVCCKRNMRFRAEVSVWRFHGQMQKAQKIARRDGAFCKPKKKKGNNKNSSIDARWWENYEITTRARMATATTDTNRGTGTQIAQPQAHYIIGSERWKGL